MHFRISSALILVLTSAMSSAQQSPVPIVGTYGTLDYIEEEGDVVGTVITIVQRGSGFEVTFQRAEGVPGDVYHVSAVVHGDSIIFQLPPEKVIEMDGPKEVGTKLVPHPPYHGRITRSGLRGSFEGESEEFLPRQGGDTPRIKK